MSAVKNIPINDQKLSVFRNEDGTGAVRVVVSESNEAWREATTGGLRVHQLVLLTADRGGGGG